MNLPSILLLGLLGGLEDRVLVQQERKCHDGLVMSATVMGEKNAEICAI